MHQGREDLDDYKSLDSFSVVWPFDPNLTFLVNILSIWISGRLYTFKKTLVIVKHSILSLEGLVSIICVLVIVALFLHTQQYPLDPISVYWVKMFKVYARIMTSMKKNKKKFQSKLWSYCFDNRWFWPFSPHFCVLMGHALTPAQPSIQNCNKGKLE